MEHIMETSTL
jgi:hypothetical protein